MADLWSKLPKDLRERLSKSNMKVIRSFPGSKRKMLDTRRVKVSATAWANVLSSGDPDQVQKDAEREGVVAKFWKPSYCPPLFQWILKHDDPKNPLVKFVQVLVLLLTWFCTFLPYPLDEFSEECPADLYHENEMSDFNVELITDFASLERDGTWIGMDIFFSQYGWMVEAVFVAMRTKRLLHITIAAVITFGTILFSFLRKLRLIGRPALDLYIGNEPMGLMDIIAINRAYWECFYFLKWQQGDVLILNNTICSHGRMPYSGPRKVLTAFG